MNIPCHVGIIMDGNGRWARMRGKKRINGHQEGLKAAKAIVKHASDRGVRYLSLYAFSTENWKRAESEVTFLMSLIAKNLKAQYDFYRENRIRVVHSGDISGLPDEIQKEINDVSRDTSDFDGLTVNLLINYGGRDAIIRSCRRWIQLNHEQISEKGVLPSEKDIADNLDHPGIPDPDLIIRTAGEKRLSNFLTWEGAYAELFFCDKLWPDFNADDFDQAIADYRSRERRFGGAEE